MKKMDYTSSQIVHLLPFPYEITDIINSFCFEDIIKAKMKQYKKIICYKFKVNEYGRKDDDGHWALWLKNSKVPEKQFQAVHCMNCGNYLITGHGIITQKIKCNCQE